MSFFNNLLTTQETFELNYQLKNYIKVIFCITVGILIYAILKKLIDRNINSENLNLFIKVCLSVLLIYFISKL